MTNGQDSRLEMSSSSSCSPSQYEIPIGLWVAALEPYVHRNDATVRVLPIKDKNGAVQAIRMSVCVQKKIVSEMTHLIQQLSPPLPQSAK